MSAQVTLVIDSGPAGLGQGFSFAQPQRCLVGRDAACQLLLEDPRSPPLVGRRHCELILEPPSVLVRDLDSLNGTFINGQLLGNRASPSVSLGRLFDGDVLGVADYRLLVRTSPAACAGCLEVIPDDPGDSRTLGGRRLCPSCLSAANAEGLPSLPSVGLDDAVSRLLRQARRELPVLQMLRDYDVERELGRGGMGAVYLVRHAQTGERLALKVMLGQHRAREDSLRRFLREIDNTRALRHRHVVSAFDSGSEGDTLFFTMEYCQGGNLEQLVRQRGTVAVPEAVGLIVQVLDALSYAHDVELPSVPLSGGGSRSARGLVHRDLKPGNLLLTAGPAPIVKVADFGLAKAFELAGLSGHTSSGTLLGTPSFCPRQQMINARDVGPEVDVWATAACLYYLLTRSYVRHHPAGDDVLTTIMQQPVVPIRRRRPDLPEALADLIDHALVEEPAVPAWSAAEFRDALLAVT